MRNYLEGIITGLTLLLYKLWARHNYLEKKFKMLTRRVHLPKNFWC